MKEINKTEIAKFESLNNTIQQKMIDEYLSNPIEFEKQVNEVMHNINLRDLHKAGKLISFAMMELHLSIIHRIGKAITERDIEQI